MKKIALISLLTLLSAPLSAHGKEPVAVVELFTSQSCSSCPPADAFLGELAVRQDLLALAYHVDYWDYIGWEDVHASSVYAQRQRDYARAFNLSYVYTPQMVVSGGFETSGNSRRNILQAIEDQLSNPHKIDLVITDQKLILTGSAPKSDIYHVTYLKEQATQVRRGENRGKTLTDYHIVKKLEKLASWSGGEVSLDLPVKSKDSTQAHAVFVQDQQTLKIYGAIKLP